MKRWIGVGILLMFSSIFLNAQIVINEGSNRNFNLVLDEDAESEDWIELYNAGSEAIDLAGYSLSDNAQELDKWTFSSYLLQPNEYLLVFCSGKDRYYSDPFQQNGYFDSFTPQPGWNEHVLQQPFDWDGESDIVIDVCSYNDNGYTVNSIFNQSQTNFISTVVSFIDGSDAACGSFGGEVYSSRPNIRINGNTIGSGTVNNGDTGYPAP